MIRIIIDNRVVETFSEKAYFKKNLKVDIKNHKGGTANTVEYDLPLPMIRDMDIILNFGRRPQTDLEMIQEDERQTQMDRESLISLEKQRLLEGNIMDITDPHHPDYIAPGNYSDETKAALKQSIEGTVSDSDIKYTKYTVIEEVPESVPDEVVETEEIVEDDGTSTESADFILKD